MRGRFSGTIIRLLVPEEYRLCGSSAADPSTKYRGVPMCTANGSGWGDWIVVVVVGTHLLTGFESSRGLGRALTSLGARGRGIMDEAGGVKLQRVVSLYRGLVAKRAVVEGKWLNSRKGDAVCAGGSLTMGPRVTGRQTTALLISTDSASGKQKSHPINLLCPGDKAT